MKSAALVAGLLSAIVAAHPALAANGLDCGQPPDTTAAGADLGKVVTGLRGSWASSGGLQAAFAKLRSEGVSNGRIVDHAVAAYCPLVAADPSLTLDRKREAVRRFASEMTSLVYDPDQTHDDLILTIPVAPSLSERIDVASAKAGQTREAWLVQAIEKGLAGH